VGAHAAFDDEAAKTIAVHDVTLLQVLHALVRAIIHLDHTISHEAHSWSPLVVNKGKQYQLIFIISIFFAIL
jgi:hypothetical protein